MAEPGLILRQRVPTADIDGLLAVREVWNVDPATRAVIQDAVKVERLFYVPAALFAARPPGWNT